MKDYVDHNGENIASILCLEEGGETLMTDHGFRKFRRRRKRDEAPAKDAVHPNPSDEAPSSDVVDQPEPAKPVRPSRPVRPAQSVRPPQSERPSRPERTRAPQAAQPRHAGANPLNGAQVATETEQLQPARGEMRHAPSVETSAIEDIAAPQSQNSVALPAALPDPWHVMRQVEITGLNERRSRLPLVDFFRSSPTARAFDLLRTRMLHSLRAHGWKRVAICGPTPGCGASFTAANLALSLARVPNSRTVLMDMNLRNPGVARALGLERSALYNGDMLGFLRGETRLEEHLVAASDRLALGLSSSTFHNAAEVLHETRCAAIIDDVVARTRANVALFDLPPVLHNDDVAAFLPQVDGVLLVSDGSQTTARHLKACEKMLAGHTQLLGVVLNRARSEDEFSGGA